MVTLILLLFSINIVLAQRATTYHQTFTLSESISSLIVDISYPYEIEKWDGNAIMVETNIKMKNITRQTMDFFINQGRYKLISTDYVNALKIELAPMVRKTISTKYGECNEDIHYKVYVPFSLTVNSLGKELVLVSND